MDILLTELSKYGPTGLMVGVILFLLRGQITDIIKGTSTDTAKLISAIEKNSDAMHTFGEGLSHMATQFQHNNEMFTGVTKTAAEMVSELRAIKDEIIRGSMRR